LARLLAFAALLASASCSNPEGDVPARDIPDGDASLTEARFGGRKHLPHRAASAWPEVSSALTPSQCESAAGAGVRKPGLERRPYLQQLTASSTAILYKLKSDVSDDRVVVSTPSGALVTAVAAASDSASPDGLQRVARIEGLRAGTGYCYSVGELTERIGFRTPPLERTGEPVRFVVFGDSGSGSAAQLALRDQLLTEPFDLLLHTGDLAYENGSLEAFSRNFFGVYAGLLERVPVFPVPGNHEYMTDEAGPFLEVFDLPDNGVSGRGERWYSFDWGDIHFIGLDTEQLDTAQIDWLERDLANTQRDWVIVFLHQPAYSSGVHGGSAAVEAAFVPLLEAHEVPIVFAGHDHDYERSVPIRGVTYVVTGGGGKSVRRVGRSWFTAHSESVTHFVSVEVRGGTLSLRAIDAAGREFDSAQIDR
jgi:3',5'-cyclic AMP phosphodiesterase CpdA